MAFLCNHHLFRSVCDLCEEFLHGGNHDGDVRESGDHVSDHGGDHDDDHGEYGVKDGYVQWLHQVLLLHHRL